MNVRCAILPDLPLKNKSNMRLVTITVSAHLTTQKSSDEIECGDITHLKSSCVYVCQMPVVQLKY